MPCKALRCAGHEHRRSVGFADSAEPAERQSEPTIVEGQEAPPDRPLKRIASSVSMSNLHHGLYIILISLHGLVRGDRMELGKDPDTGGQVRAASLFRLLSRCKVLP